MNTLRSNSRKIALLALCVAGTTAAQALAAGSALPIYPSATKLVTHLNTVPTMCGSKVELVSYRSAADGKAVAKWYASTIPGGAVIDTSSTDSSSVDTEVQVFTPDGSGVAVIHQMTMMSANLQAAAKSLNADKTGIGLETFNPPLGADFVSLMKRAKNGDAAAKAGLAAKCQKS